MTLRPGPFTYDVVSNGKATAARYADLRFASSGAVIDRIHVRNGQRVTKGQTIAELDRFRLENAEVTARNSLERAQLDMADALIGQGYDPATTDNVPDNVMRIARLRSGVAQAEVQLREAERALTDAVIRAPFDGVVANLSQKEGNLPENGQPLCRLIALGEMEVDFTVLESELPMINEGDAVVVRPFVSEESYTGHIAAINPAVDKDGMVRVKATVTDRRRLFDGMNVTVTVRRRMDDALVVPKSAVVLRSGGRPVVFTYSEGTAIWNYITISAENYDSYLISDGLTAGDEVIVSGNLNLSHEAKVFIDNRLGL